jgi:hypothetical protein
MPLAVDFRKQIAQEIDNAAANGWIVGFITANALASQSVQYEIEYARSVGGRFVPILLEPVSLPPPLNLIQCPSSDNLRQRGRFPDEGFCSSGVGV